MLRIALIDLDYPQDELNEPLGIEMLAAILESFYSRGVTYRQVCLQIPHSNYLRMITEFKPDVLALSTKIGCLSRIEEIVAFASSRSSSTSQPLIVLGGTLATLEPEELLRRFPSSICVVGEGEDALAGITDLCLESRFPQNPFPYEKCATAGIPNLVMNIADRIVHSRRNSIANLDRLPLPKREFISQVQRNNGLIRAEASRGCPWRQCTFCMIDYKYTSSQWRAFSMDRVLAEATQRSDCGASLR